MFLYNDNSPVTFNDALPESVDVVVIGGGIIGISTAWYLRKRGFSVLVCDKGRVNGEQSSRNWGWVRVTGRDPDEVPVAIDSLKRWKEIAAELDEDIGLKFEGILALAHNEKELEEFEGWMPIAKEYELDTRMMSRDDVRRTIEVPANGWAGGIITPSDGKAEPFTAVPAMARGLQKKGGLVRENCAVRTIESEAGKVSSVVTEHGPVSAQAVVCAAGVWSTLLLSNMGFRLPQLGVSGTVVRTEKAPAAYDGAAALHDVFIRRRQDGGYTVATTRAVHTIGPNSFRYLFKFMPSMKTASEMRVALGRDVTQQSFPAKRWGAEEKSPFEQTRVLDPKPSSAGLKKIRRNLDKHLPQMRDVAIAESWSGVIDATPDVVPVMDEVSSLPGLYIATGFSGHGFGIGPGAGQVMADMIAGDAPRFDLSRFRFSRFSDGSKMRPGPSI